MYLIGAAMALVGVLVARRLEEQPLRTTVHRHAAEAELAATGGRRIPI